MSAGVMLLTSVKESPSRNQKHFLFWNGSQVNMPLYIHTVAHLSPNSKPTHRNASLAAHAFLYAWDLHRGTKCWQLCQFPKWTTLALALNCRSSVTNRSRMHTQNKLLIILPNVVQTPHGHVSTAVVILMWGETEVSSPGNMSGQIW